MVTKVFAQPEIWRIPVELPQNPLRSLNVYVLRADGENLVIDTGFNREECRAALWAGIRELELDLAHTSLFLTHLHSDHIGLAPEFAAQGCTVYMNELDYDLFRRMKSGEVWPYMENLFCREGFPAQELRRQATENQGRRYAPSHVFPATTVTDGTRLRIGNVELRCIHTPGHTPGHTALYLPDAQLLFSGDHILFDITPNISVWMHVEHSLRDYLGSLRKIAPLPIQATFPAHRENSQDVYGRIAEILEHHRQRLDEICQAVNAEGGADAYTIASRIRWVSRGTGWTEFSPHQKWFAVGETLAHLDMLAEDGHVSRRETTCGVRYFAAEGSSV